MCEVTTEPARFEVEYHVIILIHAHCCPAANTFGRTIPKSKKAVAVISPVMLVAFLVWFLWLSAFLYCLVKAFQKADHWSIKVLAVIMFSSQAFGVI
jgi:hypothetical protein